MLMEVSEDMSDFQKDVVLTLDSLFEQAFKSRHDNFFIQILFISIFKIFFLQFDKQKSHKLPNEKVTICRTKKSQMTESRGK